MAAMDCAGTSFKKKYPIKSDSCTVVALDGYKRTSPSRASPLFDNGTSNFGGACLLSLLDRNSGRYCICLIKDTEREKVQQAGLSSRKKAGGNLGHVVRGHDKKVKENAGIETISMLNIYFSWVRTRPCITGTRPARGIF